MSAFPGAEEAAEPDRVKAGPAVVGAARRDRDAEALPGAPRVGRLNWDEPEYEGASTLAVLGSPPAGFQEKPPGAFRAEAL